MNSYLTFTRECWAELRKSTPMTLTEKELTHLRGINEYINIEEVSEIYLPLIRLLQLHIESHREKNVILEQFLTHQDINTPFIIGIAGSVAVGKSTTARIIQTLLKQALPKLDTQLITTDGFLYPNKTLIEKNIMHRKGFPESYDTPSLVTFVADVKSGAKSVSAPIYSHLTYDITNQCKIIESPDILIIEGLNVLQNSYDYPNKHYHSFVSDFLDFSIYVDASREQLKEWYVKRFLKLRESAFKKSGSYFSHYTELSPQESIKKAQHIWDTINGLNLEENILPTKKRANLILSKGKNHSINQVAIRK
ncbi:type I pantothenate kinase [uncultured Aliivibrio sp.]|uniref:type I pantothenate kinase n=1 Tax=uncultured Aliivibrio sp. TaxID=873085 RepID=UPI00260E3F41|nr:type I pantothenate kinase [uncultured Aliivibrio sp.]